MRFKKCNRCMWSDNCPLNDMEEEEILAMIKRGNEVNPNDFADFENCRSYFDEYCEEYTPFDDDELAIIEYERNLKERVDDYEELVAEQNDELEEYYEYKRMFECDEEEEEY